MVSLQDNDELFLKQQVLPSVPSHKESVVFAKRKATIPTQLKTLDTEHDRLVAPPPSKTPPEYQGVKAMRNERVGQRVEPPPNSGFMRNHAINPEFTFCNSITEKFQEM